MQMGKMKIAGVVLSQTAMLRLLQSRLLFVVVFFIRFLLSLTLSRPVALHCGTTCGSYSAPYPFGFSAGCPILLDCSGPDNSSVRIGEFAVRNITSDAILVDVPPACDRSVDAARGLFGRNYALSRRNDLFLRNCTAANSSFSSGRCAVSALLLDSGCRGDPTCFYNVTEAGYFSPASIAGSGCSLLYTSIGYAYYGGGSVNLRTAELEWWLEGLCQCSAAAKCTTVRSPVTGRDGFRCSCGEGFEGDGFAHGAGCQKVSKPKCSATEYVSGACRGVKSKVGILIGGIIAGASAMAILAFFCCFIRRQSSLMRKRKSMRRLLSEASCTVPLFSFKDIEKATDGFSTAQILGTGAYGTVFAGKFADGRLVAVKKIKNRDDDSLEQVMNEIKLLSSVSHPNLLRLLGCCVEQGEQILVYEYMPHGTLAQHLQRERGPPLPWTVRLTIAAETAKAIAYLHSAVRPPIYHRDIKSSNILLDANYNPKVADFGLSRTGAAGSSVSASHISTAPQGTPGYVDPQYQQNFHLSDKSDVYSFGVVLVEIITALKAVDFSRAQSEVSLAAMAFDKISRGRVDEIIDPHLDPHKDAWTLTSIYKVAELAFRCLAFHGDARPSMTEVADELEQTKLSGWALAVPDYDDGGGSVFSSRASSLRLALPWGCNEKPPPRTKPWKSGRSASMEFESPVSVQEYPWLSEQSSPSANSLLGNIVLR